MSDAAQRNGLPGWATKALLWTLTALVAILGAGLGYVVQSKDRALDGLAADLHGLRAEVTSMRVEMAGLDGALDTTRELLTRNETAVIELRTEMRGRAGRNGR